ncbi:hypothetical protein XS28_08000 [Salmonella enterica subsp. enterica]|uniref:hypothetical protein n=1 Tax=Salmonella enterica TaxID=28901 RepID=UPI00071AB108|nr:hypothetical protein [Salmonella enterica]EAB6122509.1 hypothetical protein [Salmonella enterica subsp. enterica serovar Braenderup]EAB8633210.1 hypothetical protein [Salmonella enterica subsp. enterica]EBS0250458.1 hypothetical protein [Salmonella enterica subsp. enterica serovar Give]ECE8818502.1 hypothetical protein [Salmonella enterica subsp. enterica serovar Reading]EDE7122815.1 hypothetical protein [Salmonella enterica subsp. enterica serovar Hvittingfoss]EEP8235262.1 hypothetical pr
MSLNYFGQAFKLAFEVSPILLVDGIASDIPGGVMPIAVLTEGLSIVNGLLHGEIRTRSMAAFTPMAGTTLIQQEISNLNFYNQVTAANATIRKPNRVVMQMIRPASTEDGGYATKGMTFTALKMALDMHNQYGGCYTVMTPSFIYTRCLMRSFVDTSGFSEQNKQVQHTWQLEFEQPLSSVEQTVTTLASVLDKFDKGIPEDGPLSWSGIKSQVALEFGIGI